MYKLCTYKNPEGSDVIDTVVIVERNTFIPFDPANTDYQKFKSDVLAGAELQDADGTPMSQEAATAFIGTLP